MSLTKIQKQLLIQKREELRSDCCGNLSIGCPDCSLQLDVYRGMAQGDVPTKFWEEEIESLSNGKTKRMINSYVKNLTNAKRAGIGIYFAGPNGTGKTMAACIILKEAIRQGFKVKFTTLGTVIGMFCDSMYDKELRKEFQREILEVDFLVLDDVDKQYKSKKTDFLDSLYDQVFRERCNNNLPVILTSNVLKEDFNSTTDNVYGVSLFSLFNEHLEEIVVSGKDRRKDVLAKKMKDIFNE